MGHDTNPQPASIGRELDERYRIGEELGRGGLGTVYRATHKRLDKPVAIKLLQESQAEDAHQRARFEREAKALATLNHPNVVAVLDYGISGNTPYLVMELLEGETLAARLAGTHALDAEIAFAFARALLSALAFVHGRGLVHRDVKPGNVFLQRGADGSECLKLLDFGLAKFTTLRRDDATLTRAGDLMGTPGYMPPEQIGGDALDPRSDIYAVGVIMFQMLAGRLPFEGDAADQLRGHLAYDPPALSAVCANGTISKELDAILQRAMAKAPADRYADASAMLAALEALPQPRAGKSASDPKLSAALAFAPTLLAAPAGRAADATGGGRSNEAVTAARAWIVRGVRSILFAGVKMISAAALLVIVIALAAIYLAQHHSLRASDLERLNAVVSPRISALKSAAATIVQGATEPAAPQPAVPESSSRARAAQPSAAPTLRARSHSHPRSAGSAGRP